MLCPSEITCPFAKEVWSNVPLHQAVLIAAGDSIQDVIVKFQTATCLPPSGITKNILPWICWVLWTTRNTHIFENKVLSAKEVAAKGIKLAREWIQAQDNLEKKKQGIHRAWITSHPSMEQEEWATCRSDAAWNKTSQKAGLAWIINGAHNAITKQGSSVEVNVPSPIVAEALAL